MVLLGPGRQICRPPPPGHGLPRNNNTFVNKHTTLLVSIATCVALFHIPRPAYGEIDPNDVADFAAKDLNRLRGQVVRAVVQKSPYVDILEGGTMESGVSDTQRVSVQERAAINQSLVRPQFTPDTQTCGTTGPEAEMGETEYTYTLATNRGKGPLVCIKGMWAAFKTAYSAAENSLRSQLVQLNNADVRINLVDRSGCKAIFQAGASFSQMFDGTIQAIDTPFPNLTPNALPTFKFIQAVGRFMREVLLVEPWDSKLGGNDMVMKVIASIDTIDFLRDDAEVRSDERYIAAGSYDIGKNTLLRYTWEGPYRGFAFGVDPEPLRFDTVTNGVPNYIEPQIQWQTTKGIANRPNPAWVRAKYEVMLVMGKQSFMKLAPETYTGEGSWKFPAQGVTGELMWTNIKDNDKNVWQDYGRHYYQFTRAYKPIRPHAVCAIAYARQQVDFGGSAITNNGDWSSTASI